MERIYNFVSRLYKGQCGLFIMAIVGCLIVMGMIYSVQHSILNVVDGNDTYWWFPKILIGLMFTFKITIICYHVFWTDKIYLQKRFSQIEDILIIHQTFPTLATNQETWTQMNVQEREIKISEIDGSLQFYFRYIPDLFIVQFAFFILGWVFITDTDHHRFVIFYVTFSTFEIVLSVLPTAFMSFIFYLKREWNQSAQDSLPNP